MNPLKILITGCNGQLGSDLVKNLSGKHSVTGIDIENFDLRETANTSDFIKSLSPDMVLHCAAYTDVDGCEKNAELAINSNTIATTNIADACKSSKIKMVFYSTDYVFDGQNKSPYIETDIPNPQTIYGKSKRDAEIGIMERLDNYAILRLAWLYGANGNNFPKTIIKAGLTRLDIKNKGGEATPLKVVNDQIGNPTWTIDVVRQTEAVVENDLKGIFHCTAEGETSWYGFSVDIFALLGLEIAINPCTTDEYPRPAKRPKYSSLENRHFKDLGFNYMRHYKIALTDFIKKHGAELLKLTQ